MTSRTSQLRRSRGSLSHRQAVRQEVKIQQQGAETTGSERYVCIRCGAASTAEQYYVSNPDQIRGKDKVCVTCAAYKHRFGFGLATAAGSVAFALYWGAALTDTPGGTVVFMLMMPVFTFLGIALHELGHALAGAAVGGRLVALSFGGGRKVRVVRYKGCFFLFGWRPIEGMTLISDVPKHSYRWRMIGVYSAGPLTNLLVALPAILFLAAGDFEILGINAALAALWAFVNLLMFAGNLFPFQTASGFGVALSDGRQILTHLAASDEDIEAAAEQIHLGEIYFEWLHGDVERAARLVEPWWRENTGNADIAILASAIMLSVERYEMGVTICEQALLEDVPDDRRAVLESNLACCLIKMEDDNLFSRIDELTCSAMETLPMIMAVRATRGSYLARTEQYADAVLLLHDKRYKLETPLHQATVACALAKAYLGLGLVEKARGALALARNKAPSLKDIQEVATLLAQVASPNDSA